MKKPEACGDLSEIRSAIDRIDMQLIDLISARAGYVKAAAKFKADTGAVKAPERVRKMLEERKQWAREHQLDPGFVEKIFTGMIDYFIDGELKQWSAENTNGTDS